MSSQNLLGSLLLALSGFALFGFVLPVYDEIKVTRTAISEREASIAELQLALQSVDRLKTEMQQKVEEVDKLGGVIADEKRADEVLASVDTIANQSGMQILQFSMGDVSRNEGVSTAGVDMNLRGSYLSFMSFLENLENNLRLFDVQNVSITSPEEGGLLNINLKLNLYHLQ